MILQALHDYYQRKMADPDPSQRLPAFGREYKEIPFILELTHDGRLAGIKDTRSGVGKQKSATRFLVPKSVKKASGVAANLLWDNAEYVLGMPDAKKLTEAKRKGQTDEYNQRLREMHSAFKARITALPAPASADAGVLAVLAFLEGSSGASVAAQSIGTEIAQSNPNLTFRLVDDLALVCGRPDVVRAADVAITIGAKGDEQEDDDETDGSEVLESTICLITGNHAPPTRLHDAIKGVWGAQTSGANIVAVNNKVSDTTNGGKTPAFASFGKQQGFNSPVSRSAAFAYTTALNHLLGKGSRQRMQVGDASTVFWAQRADDADMEAWFSEMFGDADDPDARTEQVRSLFEAIHSGRFDGERGTNRFFVLGLAPNAARIAVRFWHAASLTEIAKRTGEWFDDLKISRGPNDVEYPVLRRLLSSVCLATKDRPYGDIERLPPTIAGDLMRSALDGTPLPSTLLQATVQRCRADQSKKTDAGKPVPNVNYHRAAILKACLNRLIKHHLLNGKEIAVSLDLDNAEPAYLWGRLFAAYERIQSDAAGRDLNRTVRDTYFGAAMSNPATVFPRLIQLNQHHMRDLKRNSAGLHVIRDRLVGEIWDKFRGDAEPPANQPLAERARFALGYYHQRQAFFTK